MSSRFATFSALALLALGTTLSAQPAQPPRGEFVLVSARQTPKPVVKTYPIADLVVPRNAKFTVRSDGTSTWASDKASSTCAADVQACHVRAEQLIRLIGSTIDPQSWKLHGGNGTIDYFPLTMSLVVQQDDDIHAQVADLLQAMRRLRQQPTVRVRQPTPLARVPQVPRQSRDCQVHFEFRMLSVSDGFTKTILEQMEALERKEGKELRVPGADLSVLTDRELFLLLTAAQGDKRSAVYQSAKGLHAGQSKCDSASPQLRDHRSSEDLE